ncbi:cytochrome P450 [Streptomyces sp. NPDC002889]|uniref:cytochrome P450 n=1 Tax=Streptomyces sp. NPDC002889 TaxID=3364669 RepID=UPI0036CB7470
MEGPKTLNVDGTLALMAKGYGWLPGLMRHSGGAPVHMRLLGHRAIALHGPDAVRFFYDETHIRRRSALPGPVLDRLFGRSPVHTPDGRVDTAPSAPALLEDEAAMSEVGRYAADEWDTARGAWARRAEIELFTESSVVITRAVCAWAGVPLPDDEVARGTAHDLVAMVDGFATPGPRHWRARGARAREEKRLGLLIEQARDDDGATVPGAAPAGYPLRAVALHRDEQGELLDTRTAAVELLDIIRPTVAVAWYVTFAAHALHRWPRHRKLLREDPAYAGVFARELRRFYPFVPFVGGLAATDLWWRGEEIPEDSLVLLDVYGLHHDPALWPRPYAFDPSRFLGRTWNADALIPPGGVDAAHGHSAGEDITLALLGTLSSRLAALDYGVPLQDLTIPLNRLPTRPRSGFVVDPSPLADVTRTARPEPRRPSSG